MNTAPFQSHSETSRIAARGIEEHLGRLQLEALRIFSKHPKGLIDEELTDLMGVSQNTARPRRIDLCDRRLVMDSGYRRRNANGRLCVVWRMAKPHERIASTKELVAECERRLEQAKTQLNKAWQELNRAREAL